MNMQELSSEDWKPPAFLDHPMLYKAYLAKNLPLALLSGIKPVSISFQKAVIALPFTFLTKNPFQSIYFACLCMASELSSGILGMSHVLNSGHNISLLVVHMEAEFTKKAKQKVLFTCNEGAQLAEAINKAVQTEDPQKITVTSTGKDKDSNEIARFKYTWSFKKGEK